MTEKLPSSQKGSNQMPAFWSQSGGKRTQFGLRGSEAFDP
jgi:hypothetical protein